MSTAQQSDLADHLFTQAIQLPPAERVAFLVENAGFDSSLRTKVASMLYHFDRISGFLEAPLQLAEPTPQFNIGDELAGRFRIERFIARGGMGEVYAAYDKDLKEHVAVKAIGSYSSNDSWHLERFRAEIRLGRKVAHRNICKIYDIYGQPLNTGGTLLFFAMELLEGETLAAKLAREGPLPRRTAVPILRQVLAGLAEAHNAGIVHGDFKPGNVILVDGRAVITDFGLARAKTDPAAPKRDEPGLLAGSLAYMAPEQFNDGHVGPAADIFSVGVVMYEMLEARLPFPRTPISRAYQARLAREYEPPQRWRPVISKCLLPEPAGRPKDIQEITAVIGNDRLKRRTLIGTAGAAVAGGILAVMRSNVRLDIPSGMPLLLLPAQGQGSSVVDQLLRIQLNQSAHFEILEKDRIALALQRMGRATTNSPMDRRTAREVALREGSPLVIAPSLQSNELRLEIERLGSHPYFAIRTWNKSFSFQSERDLPAAVSNAADWIRRSIGEDTDELARRDRRPEEVTTTSWDSLLEYVTAERARARGDDAEAVRRLRQALAIDDAFPLAQMRLAEFLLGLGQADEAYGHWMRAANLVEERKLTDRESFRIRALFLHDMAEYAAAEKVCANWAADFKNSYLPYFYWASCLKLQGRYEEALTALNHAYAKAPGNVHVALNRAQLYLEQGRLQQAKFDLDSMRQASDWWWQYQAEYHFVSGNYQQVWECFEHLATLAPEWQSKSFNLKACLLFECGQPEEAIRLLQAGISYDRTMARLTASIRRKLLLLASGAIQTKKINLAIASAREAAADCHESAIILRAATLLGHAGDNKAAVEIARGALAASNYPVYRTLRLRYEAALTTDSARKVALLRESKVLSHYGTPQNELAYPLSSLHLDGEAQELWLQTAQFPARYWLEPDRNKAGSFRESLIALSPQDAEAAKKLDALTRAGSLLVGSARRA